MIISNEHREAFVTFFMEIFQNDEATKLAMMFVEVANVWDDIVDGDNEYLEHDDINKAFRYLVYDIPKNRIYQAIPSLPDHWLNVYLRWRDSDDIECGYHSEDDLNKCYMLRAGLYDLFSIIAWYLRGDDEMKTIGPMIRRFYGETLEQYKEEFINA